MSAAAALSLAIATTLPVTLTAAATSRAAVARSSRPHRHRPPIHPPSTWVPAPDSLADGRRRLIWIDFGPSGAEIPGTMTDDGSTPNHAWAWTGGMVRSVRRNVSGVCRYARDVIEGDDATFRVSVRAGGSCRLLVGVGDAATGRGPFDILVDSVTVVAGIRTEPGELRVVPVEIPADRGEISMRLRGQGCASWAVAGLAVYAPEGASLAWDLFPAPPTPGSGDSAGSIDPRERELSRLRSLCEALTMARPSDGCFSLRGAWYETAYPVRALLAGGQLLGEGRFSEEAIDCVERFVSEQHADGSWSTSYFGAAGCPLARAEIDSSASANLADVGTMALAMAVAAGMVEESRAVRYRAALVRYADRIVLPCQMPDGSFPNRLWFGTDYRHPYSVATGVQAAFLSALAAVTGERRFQAAADRAARFLVENIDEDGLMQVRSYDRPQPVRLAPIRFGEIYYVLEGLIWTRRFSEDAELVGRIDDSLDRWLWGRRGLAGWVTTDGLWRPADAWEASKQGALLFVLKSYADVARARTTGPPWRQAETEAWIARLMAFLGDPKRAARIGVGMNPAGPGGSFAFAATGFSGVGMAAAIDPRSIFPPPPRTR